MDWKTCVRLRRIKTHTTLASLQSHGRRLDPSSKDRVDPGRSHRNLAFSAYLPEAPLNLVAAWEVAKARLEAGPYGQAAIAAHVLAIVSPAALMLPAIGMTPTTRSTPCSYVKLSTGLSRCSAKALSSPAVSTSMSMGPGLSTFS